MEINDQHQVDIKPITMISKILLVVLVIASYQSISGFQLFMSGGRSKAEVGLSKRQMYRSIRDKLNTASKTPGFFDVGEGPPVRFTSLSILFEYGCDFVEKTTKESLTYPF